MRSFFKSLDWRVRWGLASGLLVLAFLMVWLSAMSVVYGPWYLPGVELAVAYACVLSGLIAWDPKYPKPISEFVKKWEDSRKRATKTKAGKFVWGVGRSCTAMVILWQLSPFFDDFTWQFSAVIIAGAGISFGFFGLEAAIWGALVTAALVQLATVFAMGVNFGDPEQRAAFMSGWQSGQIQISWIWMIGFILTAPAWIGLSGSYKSFADKISEEMESRHRNAEDKKRIDARKARLKKRSIKSDDDELSVAERNLKAATEKVNSFGKSGYKPEVGEIADGELAVEELKGVEKLENDHMIKTLGVYCDRVKSILRSEDEGIDVATEHRHGFDRVLLKMSDSWIEFLRKQEMEAYKMLLSYYDKLCANEGIAMRDAVGEVVISSAPKADNGYEPSASAPDTSEVHDILEDEDEDEDEEDDLAHGYAGGGFEDEDDGLPMQLASNNDSLKVGNDGTPKFEGVLPVSDDEGNEDEMDNSDEAEGLREESVHIGNMEMSDDSSSIQEFEVEEHAIGQDGKAVFDDEDADERDDEEDQIDGIESQDGYSEENVDDADIDYTQPAEDGVINDEGDTSVDSDADDANENADAASNQEDAVGELVTGDLMDSAIPISEIDDKEKRNTAGMLLSGRIDREFVLKAHRWLTDIEMLSDILGIEKSMFEDNWHNYSTMVEGAKIEKRLAAEMVSEDRTVEVVEGFAAALEAADWEHDVALVASAHAWIQEEAERLAAEEAERQRLEDEARIKREEEEAAEAQRVKDEEDRIRLAAEEAKRAREAEEERLRKEEEQRLADEAEAKRLAELEKQRVRVGGLIMMNKLNEDALEIGFELFPTVEVLAESFSMDIADLQAPYDAFLIMYHARQKYQELKDSFAAKDVNAVEALLEDKNSFEGYSDENIDIRSMEEWVRGERARERIHGLTDKSMDASANVGDAVRRAFMVKRTGITDELARKIDDALPKALRIMDKLNSVIELLGDNSSPGMKADFDKASADVKRISLDIISHPKAKEYVMAFLPSDVRSSEMDAWSMLQEYAIGAETLPEVAAEEKIEEKPVEEKNPEPEVEVEAENTATKRMKPVSIGAARRSLEQVQKLDPTEQVQAMSRVGPTNLDSIIRTTLFSLQNLYGARVAKLTAKDDETIWATVFDNDGNPNGCVMIMFASKVPFSWYSDNEIFYKNIENNTVRRFDAKKGLSRFMTNLNTTHPKLGKVQAIVIVSSVINEDGVTSFLPLVEEHEQRLMIVESGNSIELQNYVKNVVPSIINS